MARDPRTHDCGVEGCTRAEWRLGLCREHRSLVPFELGLQLSAATARAGYELREKFSQDAIRMANEALKEQAA